MGLVNLNLENIGGILGGIGSLAKDIRSAITGEMSPEKRAELEAKVLELESKASLGQMEINKQEAAHKSLFVAGWRPAVGWSCVLALIYNYFISPTIEWVVKIKALDVVRPELDLGDLLVILGGLLGLGAMRSYEKVNKVNNRH
jgi:hypothetical protein